MQIETTRFGTVEFGEDDIVTIADGVLGFPQCAHYLIINHKDGSPFRWLQSVEDPSLAFLVIEAGLVRGDYTFEIGAASAAALSLAGETPHLVYAVVSIPAGRPEEMTANLAGPIVINAETRTGAQLVLDDPQWTTRHRIVDEMRVAA